jgi:F420-dependent oxidoreductase-like protein
MLAKRLGQIARDADDAGFNLLAVMDHFFQISFVGPVEHEMLEAYTTLGFLAAHTDRITLQTVMTGVSYRPPGMLLKQVSTLDVLSGGRAALGIGAGWNAEEATGLGLPFPETADRFVQLEETLQLARQMFAGDETPFHGAQYRLERPLNSPLPLHRPRIMVGGSGERKTLRLVARYADACNLFPGPDVARKLEVLREHCEREGRDYDEITRTVLWPLDPARSTAQVVDDLGGLATLGISEVIVNTPDLWTPGRLEAIAELVPAAAPV